MRARLIAPSTTSENVTAADTRRPARATTRTSTPKPNAAIETVVSRPARTLIGVRAAIGIRPSERRAATNRKAKINQGTSWCSAGRPGLGRSPAVRFCAFSSGSSLSRRVTSERPSDDGTQRQHPYQLHERSDLVRQGADRQGGSEYLRHRIDGEAGQNAVLGERKPQQGHEQRQSKHHQHAQHRGERDGRGYFVRVRANHRRDGNNRRVSAYRIAAGNQDGQALRQAERPGNAIASLAYSRGIDFRLADVA